MQQTDPKKKPKKNEGKEAFYNNNNIYYVTIILWYKPRLKKTGLWNGQNRLIVIHTDKENI